MPLKSRFLPKHLLARTAVVVLVIAVAGATWALYTRYGRVNLHEIIPGQVYRSAQPSPADLTGWIGRYDLKTVVNLRGVSTKPFYEDEKKALDAAGVKMIDISLTSARMVEIFKLKRLIEVLETAERPILLHCRDGIERTGVASVLAMMAIGSKDYASARDQLSLKYLYGGSMNRGLMEMLVEYERYCAGKGIETAGWKQFRHWAVNEYYPCYFRIDMTAPGKVSARLGESVKIPVTITNRSGRAIPASDERLKFEVVTTTEHARTVGGHWSYRTGPTTSLPREDIGPGQSVVVSHALPAWDNLKRRILYFDLRVDNGKEVTTFGHEGCPTPRCEMTVLPRNSQADAKAIGDRAR
ncbi:MAG: tyrosine-protein phosphatase [Planctomycetes bacterium]|nr:tyrosine-protein phosphatase [Planctomycetota bacterium]